MSRSPERKVFSRPSISTYCTLLCAATDRPQEAERGDPCEVPVRTVRRIDAWVLARRCRKLSHTVL